MNSDRRYFHTFDALRFFSFLLVFVHHIPIPGTSFFSFFSKSGGEGVSFFFVLSGFLITYVLIHEKKYRGKILLKNFFIRRVLRIWPLFYVMILFAFCTSYLLNIFNIAHSDDGYDPNWLISILFLENYKMISTNSFPNVAPLRVMWSLCVEEHFYIVWGILISLISLKRMPFVILVSIILANISRIIYAKLGLMTADLFTNLDYFAFGAIPAYILVFREDVMKVVEKVSVKVKYLIAFIAVVLVLVVPNLQLVWLDLVTPLLFGILFSIIILSTLSQNNSLEIKSYWLNRLGIFTYSLYLFHTIIINLLLHVKIRYFQLDWIFILSSSLIATIFISALSYHVFEKQFLKFKVYYK